MLSESEVENQESFHVFAVMAEYSISIDKLFTKALDLVACRAKTTQKSVSALERKTLEKRLE
jgi:hypothetical protein